MKPYERALCDCGQGSCPEYRRLREQYDAKQRLEAALEKASSRWLDELDSYNAHLRRVARDAERRAA